MSDQTSVGLSFVVSCVTCLHSQDDADRRAHRQDPVSYVDNVRVTTDVPIYLIC